MTTVIGTDGNDTIITGDGNDNITTGKGVDIVNAGGGDDQIYSESTGGTIDGGDGFDVYTGNFSASTASLTFDIGDTIHVSSGLSVVNVEAITMGSSSGDDIFNVTHPYSGMLYGGPGQDTLIYTGAEAPAGQQIEVLTHTDGTLSGGIDGLGFTEFESLSLTGGSFDDQFQIVGVWNSSALSIDGGAGNDRAILDLRAEVDATNFIVAPDGSASGNRGHFINVENFSISGGDFADSITMGAGNDVLGGGGGDDHLDGGAGDDTLDGGAGADTMLGGDGNDLFYGDDPGASFADFMAGGAGDDNYVGVDGLDTIVEQANAGYDTIEAFVDYILPDNVEALTLAQSVPWPMTVPTSGTGNALDNLITGNDRDNVLSGLDGNDTIIGGLGADTITGGMGADILTGGTTIDILTGEPASNDDFSPDTFLDTAAGHNGDTITDFHAGDKIVITDANIAGFTVSLSGNTLTYTGGSLTLGSVPQGHIVAQAEAGGGVQLTLVTHAVANDFNGEGHSDILWRNDNGTVSDWLGQANGGFLGNSAQDINNIPASWHIVGTGDFNGDGRVDILWRNDNGIVSDWLGQANGGFAGNSAHDVLGPSNWHIVGTGDFNGDGRTDILWQNDTGTISDWLGQAGGGFAGNSAQDINSVPTSWHVVATGDFNGDGIDDVLWRNDNGTVSDWLGQASGGFVGNSAQDINSVPASWHVVGTGDFNGDGLTDVLWRNDNGTVSDWLGQANGGFVGNSAHDVVVPTSWHIVGIGDFNGDTTDDILWRNDNGTVSDWLGQSNGAFIGNSAHDTVVPSNWHVQDPFVHDPIV